MVCLVYQQNQTDSMQNQLNVPAAIGTRQEREEVNISEGIAIALQQDVLREDLNIHTRPAVINIDTGAQINVLEPDEEMVDIIPPIAVGNCKFIPSYGGCTDKCPTGIKH